MMNDEYAFEKKILSITLFLMPFFLFSQKTKLSDTAKIFLSFEDFVNRNSALIVDKSTEKFSYAFPRGLEFIKVVKRDSTVKDTVKKFFRKKKKNGQIIYRFKPGSIYGYYNNKKYFRYATSKSWQVVDGYYKIEEMERIIIYSKNINNGRHRSSSLYYFYSLGLNTELKSLKWKNIESDFKEKPAIWNTIKSNKQLNRDLETKNPDGRFLINVILSGK